MSELQKKISGEVSALYGFVDTISRPCVPPPQSVAFTESSSRFFAYIEQLTRATQRHLAAFDVQPDVSEEEFQRARDELRTIRSAWKELHQFIKPAVDADTLNQPTSLVSAMLSRLRKLPGFHDTDFAIFHTASFDYLHVNPTDIRSAVRELNFIVGADDLPSGLGLIGIPGSQGTAVFLNCLVAHEIGEYVYAEKSLHRLLQAEAEVALEHLGGEEYKKQNAVSRTGLIEIVARWCKEIFCDLFGIYLVGPCYTFAYTELFDLPNLIDKSGRAAESKRRPQIRFYSAHPSHPCRVKYQADLLKRLDWWPQIRDLDSRYVRAVAALLDMGEEEFIQAEDGQRRWLVQAFFQVLPEVSNQLGKLVSALDPGVHEFSQLRREIFSYLQEGVVPSTLFVEVAKDEYKHIIPGVLAILNSSSCFYLVGIEKLMANIEGQDEQAPAQRFHWSRRLESWTSKALSDVLLSGGM